MPSAVQSIAWTRRTTSSGVKPKARCRSLSGADAPKPSCDDTSPPDPTYLCQPIATPASIASRRVTPNGSTDSP